MMVLNMSVFLNPHGYTGNKIIFLNFFNLILYLHVSFHDDACCTAFVIPTLQFIAYHNDSFFI